MEKINQSKEDLLKSIEEVLNEALKEYEELSKMDDFQYAEDPSRPLAAAPAAAEAAAPQGDAPAAESDDEESEEEKKKKKEEEDAEGDEDEEEEMSDDTLKSEFAALKSKMEARGLMKTETAPAPAPAVEEVKKSEAAAEIENLKKSHQDTVESLNKTIAALSEKVEKIASAPQPRKGVSGLVPLKKSEGEGQSLSKSEVIGKLLDLKKSGKVVDTALITRIETNRASEQDLARIKALIG